MDIRSIPLPYQLATAEQSMSMDKRTIDEFGIDGFTLMEVAGNKAADFINRKISPNSHALLFCGKGNNAGDALVAGRVLNQFGHRITVCFIGGIENLSIDCKRNFDLLKELQHKHPDGIKILESYDESTLPTDSDLIIDGMFGTGLSSDISGDYEKASYWINDQHETPVFSMDIASGIDATTGNFLGCAVDADYTLSFGSLKLGSFLNEGISHCGQVEFVNLPFPLHLRSSNHAILSTNWLVKEDISQPRTHKYSEGIVYLIGGSEGLTGAAILAAKSAWNRGIGAVSLFSPGALMDIYEKQLVEIIKKRVGTNEDRNFKLSHFTEIQDILEQKEGIVVLGPGIGRDPETVEFIEQFLNSYTGRVIIDADALFVLANSNSISKPEGAKWILTPHPGELSLFFNEEAYRDAHLRLSRCTELSHRFESVIVSKGYPTFIGTPEKDSYITAYDNRIFARAGFGDVLAGKIAANWINNPDEIFACGVALIEGFEKAQSFTLDKGRQPSPLDII